MTGRLLPEDAAAANVAAKTDAKVTAATTMTPCHRKLFMRPPLKIE
jgi:hypothetical protein